MRLLINMIQGGCMAIADSVPGVSGGTIAFVMGFYDRFILSLNNIACKDKQKRKDAFIFLLKLMCGWVLGFGVSVLILGSIFDSYIYHLCSAFMGLSIFAFPIIMKEEKASLIGWYQNIIFTIIGIVIVAAITYFNSAGGNGGSVDVLNLNLGTSFYVFVVAMVAISTMVLPGISGSTLLLIFGLYIPVITGIKELLHFNFAYFPVIVIFGLGVILGILTTIKLVKLGLERARSQMIYFILGLMLGSLYAIVMGPTTLDVAQPAMTLETFSPVFFVLGGVIIFGLQKLKGIKEK